MHILTVAPTSPVVCRSDVFFYSRQRSLSYVREGNRLKNFDSLELFEPLNRALAEQKYEHPTPIQSKTIPAALEGHDILGCAQTGTGKTAAFALPILDFIGQEKLEADPKRPLALILAPTRELAIQIDDSFWSIRQTHASPTRPGIRRCGTIKAGQFAQKRPACTRRHARTAA